MPTAPEASDLVQQWWPLADGIAKRYGARWPWLADDFRSVAGEALWKLATSHGHLPPDHFSGYVRQGARWAILRRLGEERVHNPPAFQGQAADDRRAAELLDLIADGAADVGQEIEAAELVAELLGRASLTERQRGLVERYFFGGEGQREIARDQGVSPRAVSQSLGAALEKLRAAAG